MYHSTAYMRTVSNRCLCNGFLVFHFGALPRFRRRWCRSLLPKISKHFIVIIALAITYNDDYVARLEASGSEQLTITDDSLSNELERELLTSAAAMCLWQDRMIWYQGGRTNAFTDSFGKIGTVFVRGRAGQWRIVSRLRSMLRRFRS